MRKYFSISLLVLACANFALVGCKSEPPTVETAPVTKEEMKENEEAAKTPGI